ncbi:MAG: hypothetical protein ABIP74_03145 [Candidatus Saccharimonas sp.]
MGIFDRTLFERLTERTYQRMRIEAEAQLNELYAWQSSSFTEICTRLSRLGTLILVYSPDEDAWRASCDKVTLKHSATGVARGVGATAASPEEAVQLYWDALTSSTMTDHVVVNDSQSYRWSEESAQWVPESAL